MSALLLPSVYYLFSVELELEAFLLPAAVAAEVEALAAAGFSLEGFLEVPFCRAQMK